ncbi:sulfotransferase domain-containing protein [Patescibacteria group bacterium]|nr:sulfotransferase domain-containing protein [Patescibacteria group bacterium]MBU1673236.1 sulfotransferase domain-containing protein [Patescibacteria group bacterium]MBU1964006.1 sulfotransferase domain-containing protein [Patescibacteria group bacterium]
MIPKKLDFMGVGTRKCATTWTYECLSEHPQLCLSKNKESYFFYDDHHYSRGLDYYYNRFFDHCKPGAKAGEYSSGYFNEKAARRIKKELGNVKIIVCLRNPIDRATSNFLHRQWSKQEKNRDLAQLVKEKDNEFLTESLYADTLALYYELFGRDQVQVLIFEDIKKDPVRFIQYIYKFLEVEDKFVPKTANKIINPTNVKNIGWYNKFHINVITRFVKTETGRKLAGRRIVRKAYYGLIETPLSKITKSKPTLRPEQRELLQDFYKEDIQQLEGMIGRSLDFWR